MSNTTESLRQKIESAGDLQSVVRTMKALAASSIGQYEKSVKSLGDYYRTVELGLSVCFRAAGSSASLTATTKRPDADAIAAVVFGSDQGLVGQFNDVVTDHAVKSLAALTNKPQVWAVGERVHARLKDAGLTPVGLFSVPNSIKAITPLVGKILVECTRCIAGGMKSPSFTLFYNRPTTGAGYEPVSQRLLPLDETWRRKLAEIPWPTKKPPRSHRQQHRNITRPHSRVSLRLDLPRLRRIARERKRQPPRRDATRRQKHRRTSGQASRHLPPIAPKQHRRRTLRRDLRFRCIIQRG